MDRGRKFISYYGKARDGMIDSPERSTTLESRHGGLMDTRSHDFLLRAGGRLRKFTRRADTRRRKLGQS